MKASPAGNLIFQPIDYISPHGTMAMFTTTATTATTTTVATTMTTIGGWRELQVCDVSAARIAR